jgi:hypothetical protein
MEQRVTPGFFYGSALAALVGLLLGLMLHGSWEKHPGGPHIWFSSAAAEALAKPAEAAGDQPAADEAPPPPEQAQLAVLDAGYVPPDPLPVIRLDPDRFDPRPAAAEDAERQDVDDLVADAPPAPPPDLD